MELEKDLREFIELLNEFEVRYVLVGGYAVAYHGYPRYTGDIDFFVDHTGDNPQRLEQVVIRFGFGGIGITAQDFATENRVVQLGVPPNRIDLINSISGVTFAEVWATRETGAIGSVKVNIIAREPLKRNKAASGRDKDLIDLKYL